METADSRSRNETRQIGGASPNCVAGGARNAGRHDLVLARPAALAWVGFIQLAFRTEITFLLALQWVFPLISLHGS